MPAEDRSPAPFHHYGAPLRTLEFSVIGNDLATSYSVSTTVDEGGGRVGIMSYVACN